MRQKESEFYQLIRRNIPGFWSRIENVAGVGIPDCLWAYDGKSGLIELKVSVGTSVHFKTSQLAWFVEYGKVRKDVAIIVRHVDLIFMARSRRMIEIPRTVSRQKEIKVAVQDLLHVSEFYSYKPFNWELLALKLHDAIG